MANILVNLQLPDGKKHLIQFDNRLTYDDLLTELTNDLALPVKSSPKEDYVLSLVGALNLTDGATLKLMERHPSTLSILEKVHLVE
ncbi:MAG: hypothetical protein SF097_25780 [Acidobacteriota bacterium]|nr:hypothetical protein [Acidobacteriota bacterium]